MFTIHGFLISKEISERSPTCHWLAKIWHIQEQLGDNIKIVYLENYDIDLAKLMTSGVDVWLNTPLRPLEASGTSGMKAAVNGVPHFSVLDGWWIEGHIENKTGWSIYQTLLTLGEAHITELATKTGKHRNTVKRYLDKMTGLAMMSLAR